MPSVYEVKLRRVAKTAVVTIPKPAVEGLKWKEGDKLTLTVNDHITIRKATVEKD